MEFMETVKNRYSVRSYQDQPVEDEKLTAVLEAGRIAPSASNRQEWRFVVVKDGKTRKKLCEAAGGQKFVAEAPIVIACCAETDGHLMKCGHPCFLIDVAIAIDHITLAAADMGLGTCWIGAFDAEMTREILGIPEEIEVVELLALGYPADEWREKKRKSLEEMRRYYRG